MKRGNNGSVLILVLVIAGAAGLVLTSLSKLAITEKQFNSDARLILEAKEAAEAAVETGFAQLQQRSDTQTNFSPKALSPSSGKPLFLPKDYYDLFQNGSGTMTSKVLLPSYPYNASANWNTQDTEVIGGLVPPGKWKFIDGRIPGNEEDEFRDKYIFVREVQVFGKATVEDLNTNFRYTAYVAQNLQIRDAPLFAHAIFYNMDMEIAPGPAMDIFGSVHANGDMFIQANRGLNFYKNVSATGEIQHGRSPLSGMGTSFGNVTFTDGAGTQVSMQNGGSWIDSDMSDFRTVSSNRWNGNLQGASHGVQTQKTVAIPAYVRDDPDTKGVIDDPINAAYRLIQPLRNINLDPDYVSNIEQQKLAYKAGLIIKVNPDTASASAYIARRDRDGNLRYDSNGDPQLERLDRLGSTGIVTVEEFSVDPDNRDVVTGGLYDYRQGGGYGIKSGINLVKVDVGQLKKAIHRDDRDDWTSGARSRHSPSRWWNGIVYIDFPNGKDPRRPKRPDGVEPPIDRDWGVKLENGEEIPNPSFGWSKDIYGTTIATNTQLYVEGNYNADGDPATGSATKPDNPDVRVEPPAALLADAITVLSESWKDSESLEGTDVRTTTAFTEVAAAFLTGLVPSNKAGWGYYSGGVENFPRFLEIWKTTLRYRGSMVALFESEVALEPWGKKNVYSPPRRDWGFNSLYSRGYYPPGTPTVRSLKRVNYRNLTASEYKEALKKLLSSL